MAGETENSTSNILCIHVRKQNYICTNTHKIQNYTKTNLATSFFPTHAVARIIDFFLIPAQRRNWVKTIKNNKIENTRQQMRRRILQIYIRISLNLNRANETTNNTIPYSFGDLRGKPKDSDTKIHTFLQQFGPSYSYQNSTNINWETINNGIINILAKTYTRKNPQNIKTKTKTIELQTYQHSTEDYKLT